MAITFNRRKLRFHIWHASSTNETLSNDSRFDDFVTLIFTFILKMVILDFVSSGDISVSLTHLVLQRVVLKICSEGEFKDLLKQCENKIG